MTLQRVSQFHTSDPQALGRELNAVEDNVSRETADIRAGHEPRLQAVTYVAVPGRAVFQSQLGQQVTVDTAQAGATVVLPALSAKNFGRRVVVLNPGFAGSNSVEVRALDGSPVNGSSSPVPVPGYAITVYCSPYGYYF